MGAPAAGRTRRDASTTVTLLLTRDGIRLGPLQSHRSTTQLRRVGDAWVTTAHVVETVPAAVEWLEERMAELSGSLAAAPPAPTPLTVKVTTVRRDTSSTPPTEVTEWRMSGRGGEDGGAAWSTVVSASTPGGALAELRARMAAPRVEGVVHTPLPPGPCPILLTSFAASIVLHELIGHGTEVAGTPRTCSFDVWSHPEPGGDAVGERGDPVLVAGPQLGPVAVPTTGFLRCPPHGAEHLVRHTYLEAAVGSAAPADDPEVSTVVHIATAARYIDGTALLRVPYTLERGRAGDLGRRPRNLVLAVTGASLATATPAASPAAPCGDRHSGLCSAAADVLPLAVRAPSLMVDAVVTYE